MSPEYLDGSSANQMVADELRIPIALDILRETARTFGGTIAYGELQQRLRELSGIDDKRPPNWWMSPFLEKVGNQAERLGEPHLTSLCVNKDGKIGVNYPRGRHAASDDARQAIAERDRLECYERYALAPRRFWWVNQGQTADRGDDFTLLWAADVDTSNRRQPHWDSLDAASMDDVVLHYAHGYVIGHSVVAEASRPLIRPANYEIRGRSGDMGRRVIVRSFHQFDVPVLLEEIPLEQREFDRGEGSPFTRAGQVKNGYFFPLETSVAVAVFAAAGLVVSGPEPEVDAPDAELTEMYLDTTDGVAIVKYRKEQAGLRARLFAGKSVAACGICGHSFPIRYLTAAHIKSRHACTEMERRDWRNVVMAACLFGCDAVFEDGMIRVVDGIIRIAGRTDETRPFALFIGALDGKRAPAWTPENRHYFEWRNAQARP